MIRHYTVRSTAGRLRICNAANTWPWSNTGRTCFGSKIAFQVSKNNPPSTPWSSVAIYHSNRDDESISCAPVQSKAQQRSKAQLATETGVHTYTCPPPCVVSGIKRFMDRSRSWKKRSRRVPTGWIEFRYDDSTLYRPFNCRTIANLQRGKYLAMI